MSRTGVAADTAGGVSGTGEGPLPRCPDPAEVDPDLRLLGAFPLHGVVCEDDVPAELVAELMRRHVDLDLLAEELVRLYLQIRRLEPQDRAALAFLQLPGDGRAAR